MKKILALILILIMALSLFGCAPNSVMAKEAEYQKQVQQEMSKTVGSPDIKNFTEKKLAKTILELRDQPNLVRYAYTKNDMTGKYIYQGECIGYPMPYSVQYTNPENPYWGGYETGSNNKSNNGSTTSYKQEYAIPMADPNGLYYTGSTAATWVVLINPKTGSNDITYFEENVMVRATKYPATMCESWSLPSNY